MKFRLLMITAAFFLWASACTSMEPAPDTIRVSPSPVHVFSGREREEKPDIIVTVFLNPVKSSLEHVWLDAIATAKFGTQMLAVRQEMTLAGRTHGGLWVYQWLIPGYLLETENINNPDRDVVDVFIRAEDASGHVKKLETTIGLTRGTFEIQPMITIETLVVSDISQLIWQTEGTMEEAVFHNQLLLCEKRPDQSIWPERGCDLVSLDRESGSLIPEPSIKIADGHYWWVVQQLDAAGSVLYQSPVSEILADVGKDDWVGILLDGSVLQRSAWEGAASLYWRVYRDGVMIQEALLPTDLSWDVGALMQLPGYYEIMVVQGQSRTARILSNVLRFVVKDEGQVLSLQEEFSLEDEEVILLQSLMDDLMLIPSDKVEYFISRMAFQGVVDADGLRELLNELGMTNRDVELMAERGQVAELTHIFAQAYVRGIFSMEALQTGLADYLGGESE